LKQHQNLDGSTVRLECLYRQWAIATGQLQVKSGKTVRYAVPPPTNMNVAAFGMWIANGSTENTVVIDTTRAAHMDSQESTTAANAKRAEERAKNAPPMPNQTQSTEAPAEGVIRPYTKEEEAHAIARAEALAQCACITKDETCEHCAPYKVIDVDDTGESWDDMAIQEISQGLQDAIADNAEPTNADLVHVGSVKEEEEVAW